MAIEPEPSGQKNASDDGHPRARFAARVALLLLIFGFLIGFVATQWGRLPAFDWRFSPGWLALATVAVATLYIGQGELWRLILAMLGEQLDARAGRAVYAKSLIARYVPTNLLMVIGRVLLAERHGIEKQITVASMVYEVGLAVCGAVIAASYFVITLPPLQDEPARYAVLAIVPLALAVLQPRLFRPLSDRILRRLGRDPLARTIPFAKILLLVVLYLLTWTVMGLGLFAFASALHPLSIGDLPYVAASYPVGFCISVLTFVIPSGLGARDATLAAALAVVLPGAVATAIAVAFRIFQTAIELLYVGTAALLGRRTLNEQAVSAPS